MSVAEWVLAGTAAIVWGVAVTLGWVVLTVWWKRRQQ